MQQSPLPSCLGKITTLVSFSPKRFHRSQDRGGPSTHVPYRNCLMTLVLRDSLGGNCATAMVATLHPGLAHLDETCSTCRCPGGHLHGDAPCAEYSGTWFT